MTLLFENQQVFIQYPSINQNRFMLFFLSHKNRLTQSQKVCKNKTRASLVVPLVYLEPKLL